MSSNTRHQKFASATPSRESIPPTNGATSASSGAAMSSSPQITTATTSSSFSPDWVLLTPTSTDYPVFADQRDHDYPNVGPQMLFQSTNTFQSDQTYLGRSPPPVASSRYDTTSAFGYPVLPSDTRMGARFVVNNAYMEDRIEDYEHRSLGTPHNDGFGILEPVSTSTFDLNVVDPSLLNPSASIPAFPSYSQPAPPVNENITEWDLELMQRILQNPDLSTSLLAGMPPPSPPLALQASTSIAPPPSASQTQRQLPTFNRPEITQQPSSLSPIPIPPPQASGRSRRRPRNAQSHRPGPMEAEPSSQPINPRFIPWHPPGQSPPIYGNARDLKVSHYELPSSNHNEITNLKGKGKGKVPARSAKQNHPEPYGSKPDRPKRKWRDVPTPAQRGMILVPPEPPLGHPFDGVLHLEVTRFRHPWLYFSPRTHSSVYDTPFLSGTPWCPVLYPENFERSPTWVWPPGFIPPKPKRGRPQNGTSIPKKDGKCSCPCGRVFGAPKSLADHLKLQTNGMIRCILLEVHRQVEEDPQDNRIERWDRDGYLFCGAEHIGFSQIDQTEHFWNCQLLIEMRTLFRETHLQVNGLLKCELDVFFDIPVLNYQPFEHPEE